MQWPVMERRPSQWQADDWPPKPRLNLQCATVWQELQGHALYLPQAVIVEGVVTSVGQMDTKSCTHRIEYLDSCIHPHLQHRKTSLSANWRTLLAESCEQNWGRPLSWSSDFCPCDPVRILIAVPGLLSLLFFVLLFHDDIIRKGFHIFVTKY
jgi:hypothetical protein